MFKVAEIGVFNVGELFFASKRTDVGCDESGVTLADTEICVQDRVLWAGGANVGVVLTIVTVGRANISIDVEVSDSPGGG